MARKCRYWPEQIITTLREAWNDSLFVFTFQIVAGPCAATAAGLKAWKSLASEY